MEDLLNYKNSLVALAVVATVSGAAILGSGAVSAQSDSNSLVERIASTFNLNQNEVKQVFVDARTDHQAETQQMREEHMQSLVDAGTITEAQKATLQEFKSVAEATISELKTNDANREEVRAAMEQSRNDVKDWADSEGVDLDEIRPAGDERGHHGGLHHFGEYFDKEAI